jgi:predicted O-linked N-acetylglucosamine transferase (SPINDLY family)
LAAVNDSRLLLLAKRGSHRSATRSFFQERGIRGDRIDFLDPAPAEIYLSYYHQIDIALDPFPYNGVTTSCDALWMGAPVVTLVGPMAPARTGLSLLSNLGLPEYAAHSEPDYVRICADLAANLPKLADLRQTLRPRMLGSPLMDARGFARYVEAAYRQMWRRWCAH